MSTDLTTPAYPTSVDFIEGESSIIYFHQYPLEFCERLNAGASFPCDGVVQIRWINPGLIGEFPKGGFPDGLFGSRNDFGGLFLFFFKVIDCGLNSGD